MLKPNFIKKAAVLSLCAVIGVMSSSVVRADSGFDFEPCPKCGDGSVWYEENEVGRFGNAQCECTHKRFGVDVEIGIHYVHSYNCVDCGYGWTYDTYEYYWDCQGYDDPVNH